MKTHYSKLLPTLQKIESELVTIFGSYLRNYKVARDLDLIVISNKFEDIDYQNRRFLLPKNYMEKQLDPYCFTKNEFKLIFDRNHPLIKAVSKNHINLIGEFDEYF